MPMGVECGPPAMPASRMMRVSLSRMVWGCFGQRSLRVVAGLGADIMHLFKKADEGVGDRDRSDDCRAVQENGSAGDVDLRGCQSFRFRQIAAGVMEQTAKCPRWALLPVRGRKKSTAFLVIEEKASSILVKQAYCRHFVPIG
jgi:hypothetical protein